MAAQAAKGDDIPPRKLLIGVYRHYKHTEENPRYYQVSCSASHHETGEPRVVIYRPLYKTVGEGFLHLYRNLDEFLGLVEVDGRKVLRFTYVGTSIPDASS